MALSDITDRLTINGYSIADEEEIRAIISNAYQNSNTAFSMFSVVEQGQLSISITNVSGVAQAFRGTGRVEIDPSYVRGLAYFDETGEGHHFTLASVVIHELVHALVGLSDLPRGLTSRTDAKGPTLVYEEAIFEELGMPARLSYQGVDSTLRISDGFEATGGETIDIAHATLAGAGTLLANQATRDLLWGRGNEANSFFSGGGRDFLHGNGGDDVFSGGAGDDDVFGGIGTDTALYSGIFNDYALSTLFDGRVQVSDLRSVGSDGTDRLSSVEFARFGDGILNIQTGGFTASGQNVVLVIDTSGSMSDDIEAVKSSAREIVDTIFGTADAPVASEFAIVVYEGSPTTILSFTKQNTIADRKAAALAAIDLLGRTSGGVENLNTALLHSIDGDAGSWNPFNQSNKIVVFTDEDADDPQLRAEVIAKSVAAQIAIEDPGTVPPEIGSFVDYTNDPYEILITPPIQMLPVLIGTDADATGDLEQLARDTNGEVFEAQDATEVVAALITAINARTGTDGPDNLIGDNAANTILARSGEDIVFGRDDADTLVGGEGDDTVYGEGGRDRLFADTQETSAAVFVRNILPQQAYTIVNPEQIALDTGNVEIPNQWSYQQNLDIAFSTSRPHQTIDFYGSNKSEVRYEFFAFSGERWTFDIDYGGYDTVVSLFDAVGQRLTFNDDSPTSTGGSGSSTGLDSYLSYNFSSDARYQLAVARYDGRPVSTSDVARLNISIENAVVDVTDQDADAQDFLDGGADNDILYSGSGRDTLVGGSGADAFVGRREQLNLDRILDYGVHDVVVISGDGYIANNGNYSFFDSVLGNTVFTFDENPLDGQIDMQLIFDGGLPEDLRQVTNINGDLVLGRANFQGTGEGDTFYANQLDNTFSGRTGTDTLVLSGDQSSYTLFLTSRGSVLEDRRDQGDGINALDSIELLDFSEEIDLFGGDPMRVGIFDGPAFLTPEEFGEIIELYIAYFNRAPDALGLFYWATRYAEGFSIPDMAASFFEQPETKETYPDLTDLAGFVRTVYNNVLGREPDTPGFDYWVDQLEYNPDIDLPIFILAVIGGAKFPSNQTAQTLADQQYLSDKTDLGYEFSVSAGMSNIASAAIVLQGFDGSTSSYQSSLDQIENYETAAIDPDTGEFLLQLVGVSSIADGL